MPGFTHLHTVSGFSARYGASHPERLAERAFERGMDALALTDRDTLAGTVRFAKACAKAGVRPCSARSWRSPPPSPRPPTARRPPYAGTGAVPPCAAAPSSTSRPPG